MPGRSRRQCPAWAIAAQSPQTEGMTQRQGQAFQVVAAGPHEGIDVERRLGDVLVREQDALAAPGRAAGVEQVGRIFEAQCGDAELPPSSARHQAARSATGSGQVEVLARKGPGGPRRLPRSSGAFSGDIGIQQHGHSAGRMHGEVGRGKLRRVGAAEHDALAAIAEGSGGSWPPRCGPCSRAIAIRNHPGRRPHGRAIGTGVRMGQQRRDKRLDGPIQCQDGLSGNDGTHRSHAVRGRRSRPCRD